MKKMKYEDLKERAKNHIWSRNYASSARTKINRSSKKNEGE